MESGLVDIFAFIGSSKAADALVKAKKQIKNDIWFHGVEIFKIFKILWRVDCVGRLSVGEDFLYLFFWCYAGRIVMEFLSKMTEMLLLKSRSVVLRHLCKSTRSCRSFT